MCTIGKLNWYSFDGPLFRKLHSVKFFIIIFSAKHFFCSYILRTDRELQFLSRQMAEDLGGPRKEFFDLILHEIKEKYFDHGLRWDFEKDYETVGLVMGK